MIGFFRSFFLLEAVVFMVLSQVRSLCVEHFLLACLLVFLWWWGAVTSIVWLHPGRRRGRVVAIALIPGLALLSIFAALLTGIAFFVFFFMLGVFGPW